jgi:hypothetical protein
MEQLAKVISGPRLRVAFAVGCRCHFPCVSPIALSTRWSGCGEALAQSLFGRFANIKRGQQT